MLDFVGAEFPPDQRQALEAFCAEVSKHPQGGNVEGRIVLAEDGHEEFVEALRVYMDTGEFQSWFSRRQGRTGITGGKTFVSEDGVITAVLSHIHGQDLLDLAAHEAIEMAHSLEQREADFRHPTDPDEADGLTLYDEYRVERVRREIASRLGWPEGAIDGVLALRPAAEEIASRMPPRRLDPPANDFFMAWLEMARAWTMACGRAAAGNETAGKDLGQWAEHKLIADGGWQPVQRSLDDLFRQAHLTLEEIPPFAASTVRRPILEYGRAAWRQGP